MMKMVSLKFSSAVLHFVLLISLVTIHASATPPTYLSHNCKNSTSFAPYSTYASNLNLLLLSLRSYASNVKVFTDFYYATAGRKLPDVVFGIFLCRGDVSKLICQDCVVNASEEIQRRCPDKKKAVIWHEECLLHYSDQPIFNVSDTSSVNSFPGLRNASTSTTVTDNDQFELFINSMVNTLAFNAANPHYDQTKKFAVDKRTFTSSETVYGLAQCTPDLSVADCSKCFRSAIEEIRVCCNGQRSVRLLLPSCYIMYDLHMFFNAAALETPPPAPLPPPPHPGKKKISSIVIVATVVPVFTALLFVTGCYLRWRARKKYNALITQETVTNDITTTNSLQYNFRIIETATNKFSDCNMLGKGGFGQVYKGTLPNGREIAVKRLSKSSSGQGAREFKNEVVLVAKLQHRNLVRLLGFCLDGEERILVYEYVPNKSLDYFLFDPKKQGQLNWLIRCNIIEGIARGVLYLHEDSRLKIIHRDLKASNILLDEKMNPKVSDFGMAKLFGVDQTEGNTGRIVGTYGYMAPEYAMEGLYSIKSDVFSFGVLLLEILSGRRNTSFRITDCALNLIAYTWHLWNEEKALDLVNPCLRDSCHPNEFLRYIQIGLLCVQENALLRPTMSSVVLMLKSEVQSLSQPERPAFITSRYTSQQEIIAVNSCSVNEITVSDFLPR
ncbi:cysteine-rich receptor-like protein kinase 10 [Morus notabilis]|uniref:cysteine-rich receptor-like protein kinase 10 n=1 Tax=Morus notabilis TaxID=981085 RepID=UPI000CED2B65|nr:cysteine-rich receptor-like protein kinase 10 [Morus notabilis]